jgi:CPA1 family monovalent cation:H+ antiporter
MGALAIDVVHHGELGLLLPAALISAVVILARVAFVFAGAAITRWRSGARAAPPMSETLFVAWTGIRGGDTLVTALAVPLAIDGGAPFPGRHEILVISFAVILVTLVIQGATLKPLIRACSLPNDDSEADEEHVARAELSRAGVDRLEALARERALPAEVLAQIRAHHHLRRHVRSGSEQQPENVGSSILASQLLDLNRQVLRAEREAVLGLRDRGEIGDEVVRRIQRELDLEELVMMRLVEED